jgi:hypothetical protein
MNSRLGINSKWLSTKDNFIADDISRLKQLLLEKNPTNPYPTRAEIKERLVVCDERCEYFRKHGHRYRKRHLKNRLVVARATHNRVAEQKILEIIKRERKRAFWRRIN